MVKVGHHHIRLRIARIDQIGQGIDHHGWQGQPQQILQTVEPEAWYIKGLRQGVEFIDQGPLN